MLVANTCRFANSLMGGQQTFEGRVSTWGMSGASMTVSSDVMYMYVVLQ